MWLSLNTPHGVTMDTAMFLFFTYAMYNSFGKQYYVTVLLLELEKRNWHSYGPWGPPPGPPRGQYIYHLDYFAKEDEKMELRRNAFSSRYQGESHRMDHHQTHYSGNSVQWDPWDREILFVIKGIMLYQISVSSFPLLYCIMMMIPRKTERT